MQNSYMYLFLSAGQEVIWRSKTMLDFTISMHKQDHIATVKPGQSHLAIFSLQRGTWGLGQPQKFLLGLPRDVTGR
jgi:hypothetical protein